MRRFLHICVERHNGLIKSYKANIEFVPSFYNKQFSVVERGPYVIASFRQHYPYSHQAVNKHYDKSTEKRRKKGFDKYSFSEVMKL